MGALGATLAEPEAPANADGQLAGRYELLLKIAQGGMGAVWVARLRLDNGFEKIFAVKTLLNHLAELSMFRQMFLDEARLAASIAHPNVAQILDVGEEDGDLYLVMEWIEGVSLKELMRLAVREQKAIPHGVLLRVLTDACGGLHAVHEHTSRDGAPLDIVHRDVSPHNVMVSIRGAAKVIDLGIAKARHRMVDATRAGDVKGKLRFMSPEQAAGRPVDRRADVWGIGAVLYATLSGRAPYHAESDVDVLRAILAGDPPPPLDDVPVPIQTVLSRALSWDPDRRYATAAELGVALEGAARELDVMMSDREVAAYVEMIAGQQVSEFREALREKLELRDSVRLAAARPSDSRPAPKHSATFAKVAAPARATRIIHSTTPQRALVAAASPHASSRSTARSGALWALAVVGGLLVITACINVIARKLRQDATVIPAAVATAPVADVIRSVAPPPATRLPAAASASVPIEPTPPPARSRRRGVAIPFGVIDSRQ